MFSVRQMRYFDALATTLHFRKAAEMVHISQPALSAQIAEMESLAGSLLFERSQRQVIITEYGRQILPHVRLILNELRLIEEASAQNNGVLQSRMRLGIIPTVAPYLVPNLLPYLKVHHPALRLELMEAMTARLIENLGNGELDAVIMALPVEDAQFSSLPLFEDRFLIATSSNDTDILPSPVTQDGMVFDRLLLLEEGHCLRDQALEVCSLPPQKQMIKYGATSLPTLLQMVSHGMGMTLIPEIAARTETANTNIRITHFDGIEPKRDIGLVTRRSSMRKKDFDALAVAVKHCAQHLLFV